MKLEYKMTPKQYGFHMADADEVLFGGAAGGGKSWGQIIDALLYAQKNPMSKQLILRRTLPELEKSLIRCAMEIYPKRLFEYRSSSHTGIFTNGSIIDFGFCANETDVYRYQSAEYDVIRFDELTHFTEYQYLYLISRLRGTNGYRKQIKSSTNPGGIGHAWVKARFIDPCAPNTVFFTNGTSRIFIPSKLSDNIFLCHSDPEYKKRLEMLPELQKKALLYGEWNVFEGQFFDEFSYDIHTCEPFEIPMGWRKWRTIDYGLDCFACLWLAMDSTGEIYLYREYCKENLVISQASTEMTTRTPEDESIYATLAPPDLWQRSQESGRSKALLFAENGVYLTKTPNDRETGWLAVKELLRLRCDGTPRLRIFRTCTEIIRCLPQLIHDRLRPSDTANEPHTITHAPDALRGFAIYYARPSDIAENRKVNRFIYADIEQDYENATEAQRAYLRQKQTKQERK